jgi:uncharacterized phiE125 gp8 family phage protein
MAGLIRTVAPAVTPVSLSETKLACRIDASVDDALVTAYLNSAIEQLEGTAKGDKGILGRALVTQTWQMHLDDFPAGDCFTLPKPPVQSVSSIQYYASDGTLTTLSTDGYQVDTVAEPARVMLKLGQTWPTVELQRLNAVVVTFVAGYGNASAVPESLKAAIHLLVQKGYDASRGGDELASRVLDNAVSALVHPYVMRWA